MLNGGQCARCGRVYFPPIGIGCENCGAPAESLVPRALPTAGVVFAVAEVNVNTQGTKPFSVTEVVLAAGPLIRAVVHPASPPLHIGDQVRARWHVVKRNDAGADLVEPAFIKSASAFGDSR
ncbi:Zn-ribbon domain-containing OB-fold protein [Nocardia sp. NPDC056000]|uniref:Zn-ribbon domain-containing OB-fold protein n=1 Tax=Nocardia sp. NPDC056000 TaxID=3345674 RepID=UPI0035DA4DC6